MAVWYLSDAGQQAMGGQLVASSLLTTVTAGGTANTAGSWIQMHAATTFPVSGLLVFLGQTGIATAATNTSALVDIGVGAAGSEQAIVSNIALGGSLPFASWTIPLAINSGARIAVRLRSAVASKSCTMGMAVYGGGGGLEAGNLAVTYGANTASSTGTSLTAPGAINTKAAWTQIAAATTSRHGWMVVGVGAPANATATATNGLIDIGVGAAAAEVAVIKDIPFAVSANEDVNVAYPLTFPVNIPSGTRLVARYQATATATSATPHLTLVGIN
jgi:hypothetical protein